MDLRTEDVLPPGYRLHWYQIQSLLGDGGFGITYLGRDSNLNQAVAIKEYYPKSYVRRGAEMEVQPLSGVDSRFYRWGLERFLEEARLLARFRHPHIVRVLSVFETLGTAYMVMELERGQSLSQVIKQGSLSSDGAILELCLPVLDGLDLVHHAGFIHRDIKPSNILLRDGLGPVLIDFGSARQPHPSDASALTAIVSRGYAPFEQYDAGNEDRQGAWSDIYGMAATLYQAISGKPPVDALARGMALLNGDKDPIVPAIECGGERFSPALLRAVDLGLAFRASERPQSIAEWRAAFPAHSMAGNMRPDVRTVALDVPQRAALREAVSRAGRRPRASPPRSRDQDQQTTETNLAAVPQAESVRDRRVMVVDDERSARSLAQRVLGNLGVVSVDLVDGGEAALTRLGESRAAPEVVICDLVMPGVDGIALLRHLAERRLRAPLVLLGEGDERLLSAAESLACARGLRVLGTLQKPLAPESLGRLLARIDQLPECSDDAARTRAVVADDELRAGLERDALRLRYLPKVSVPGRRVLGAEALVRWNHRSLGELEPVDFLAQAERLGLGERLTDRVLEAALARAGAWRAAGLSTALSINVFALSLSRLDLPERLVARAEDEGVDPANVTLEVNELSFERHGDTPLEVLARLRLRGVGLALDDFGTGSSSLERLRRVPFTEIKVDRSFVASAAREQTSRAILESSVALAKRLGLKSVAEGVEDEETFDLVASLGFDAAQGFYISPPLPGDKIVDWVARWTRGRMH